MISSANILHRAPLSHAIKGLHIARDGLLALLAPTPCRNCGVIIDSWDDGIACAACWEASRWPVSTERCIKCGLPLAPIADAIQERRCGACERMAFICARACGPYVGAWRESILWLKRYPQLAPRISLVLLKTFNQIEAQIGQISSLLPVPLHTERERARGFNQAEVIARTLARMTGLQVDATSLVRDQATALHRAGMDIAERAHSLRGAFRVRAPRLVAGRSILVIDDVMTTAATAHEIGTTLLAAGARCVSLLTLARVTYTPHSLPLDSSLD